MATKVKYDDFFTDLENTSPFFKMGAEGAAGSGKSWTLMLIAIGLHQYIESKKPIVVYDTEKAAKFLRPMFAKHNIPVITKESRTLSDLTKTMDYCEDGNAEILFVDSITHVWEQFQDAYKNKKNLTYIPIQDWGILKPLWKKNYSDRLVNGRYHILFTGREGFVYDQEVNEETGKKEWTKSGVKMRVEGDTAYEPDILVRMERFENLLTEPKEVWREATVIKGRGGHIDGMVFKNPTFENFKPVIDFLLTDVKEPETTVSHDDSPLIRHDENGRKQKTEKDKVLEEISGVFAKAGLGEPRGAKDKAKKAEITDRIFMTTSGIKIKEMTIEQLQDALSRLREDEEVVKLIEKQEKLPF